MLERRPVTLYLIRHGHAGSRKDWNGDDGQRPLSPKGVGQAEWLADQFAQTGIGQVLSSPSLRCIQTVEPLAARLGLDVGHEPALCEGAPRRTGLTLLEELGDQDVALCSHGDVIPALIRALRKQGATGDKRTSSAKAGTFILATVDGHVSTTRYLPPPS